MYRLNCLVLLVSLFLISGCSQSQPRWVGDCASVVENLNNNYLLKINSKVDSIVREGNKYGGDEPPSAKPGLLESVLPMPDLPSALSYRTNVLLVADKLYVKGHHANAAKLYEAILNIDKKKKGDKAFESAYFDKLVSCLVDSDNTAKAEELMNARDNSEPDRMKVFENRARFYNKANQIDKAEHCVNEAVRLPNVMPAKKARINYIMSDMFCDRENYAKQEEYLVRAIGIERSIMGKNELRYLYMLPKCYTRQGKYNEAVDAQLRMIELENQKIHQNSRRKQQQLRNCYMNLSHYLKKAGRTSEVAKYQALSNRL